jgi:hypothetical protein
MTMDTVAIEQSHAAAMSVIEIRFGSKRVLFGAMPRVQQAGRIGMRYS